VDKAKPFKIPKREVWEAFKRVRANQGAAGVDGQSIAEFEANLSGNLYKLWNRFRSKLLATGGRSSKLSRKPLPRKLLYRRGGLIPSP
jgi:retron-type reverse transcriptase